MLARGTRASSKKHLAELALAGDLTQWPHRHAGRVELHEQERYATVAVFRICAGEHEDPIGPRAERRPHLLAVDDELVAVEPGGRLQRREVAAGSGLAEALAPYLVPRKHWREVAASLLFGPVVNQRRTEQADTEKVDDRRRIGAGALFFEDRLLDGREPPAAPLAGPIEAEVTGRVELALPGAPHLHETILGSSRFAEMIAPRALEVRGQPGSEFVAKPLVLLGELEIHGGGLEPAGDRVNPVPTRHPQLGPTSPAC